MLREAQYVGWKVSTMNCSMQRGSIQVAPRRTSISLAVSSRGCAALSASTFMLYEASSFAAASASRNFSRTLPERYSSAVT